MQHLSISPQELTDIMKDGSLLAGFQNESEYNQWTGLKNKYYDLVSWAHFFLRYDIFFSYDNH